MVKTMFTRNGKEVVIFGGMRNFDNESGGDGRSTKKGEDGGDGRSTQKGEDGGDGRSSLNREVMMMFSIWEFRVYTNLRENGVVFFLFHLTRIRREYKQPCS
ncbi:hypothetical protein Rs2_22112 [Raphanus sativus]|nr:hypothetical protein Rs2_22112 [Raphanus sativus]